MSRASASAPPTLVAVPEGWDEANAWAGRRVDRDADPAGAAAAALFAVGGAGAAAAAAGVAGAGAEDAPEAKAELESNPPVVADPKVGEPDDDEDELDVEDEDELAVEPAVLWSGEVAVDRKSTRLNSSHRCTSYAVFCLK